jgi:hypothetical protein
MNSILSEEVIKKIKEFQSCYIVTPEQEKSFLEELFPSKKLKKRYLLYGLCKNCGQPNTGFGFFQNPEKWCQRCSTQHCQKDFKNWTSGSLEIDDFIQKFQLRSLNPYGMLE